MTFEDDEEVVPYTTIGTDEAKRLIDAGAHVIDVRQPDEWERGHIPGAHLISLNGIYAFGSALKQLELAPDDEVIFVCAMGQRSAVASEIALVTGLSRVYNLANGMNGWLQRRYPTER